MSCARYLGVRLALTVVLVQNLSSHIVHTADLGIYLQ